MDLLLFGVWATVTLGCFGVGVVGYFKDKEDYGGWIFLVVVSLVVGVVVLGAVAISATSSVATS